MSTTPPATTPPDVDPAGRPGHPSRSGRSVLHLAGAMTLGMLGALGLIAVWASTAWSVSTEGWGGLVFFIVALYSVPVLLVLGAGSILVVRAKGRGRRVGATLIVLAAAATSIATTWVLVESLPDASAGDDALLAGVCALPVVPWLVFVRSVRRT